MLSSSVLPLSHRSSFFSSPPPLLPSLLPSPPPLRPARCLLPCALHKSPKGFGKPPVPKAKPQQQLLQRPTTGDAPLLQQPRDDEEPEDDVVPEVVTNRMLKRILFTVGIPFAIGVSFFALYYYLKVVKKVDVPEWLPLFTSLLTFGSAGAGITYGVLSASWDPSRDGSIVGWKEAQLNWPVLWQTLRGKADDKSQ